MQKRPISLKMLKTSVDMQGPANIYIYLYMYTCICIYIYVYVVYIYMCVCLYIYIHLMCRGVLTSNESASVDVYV